MAEQGWISLHRKIMSNWLYPTNHDREFSKFEAWIDILLTVNHEEQNVLLGNEIVKVGKGQHVTSLRKLSNRWRWSKNKVSAFLKLLEDDGMIKLEKDSKKTIITVENYEFYQYEGYKKRTHKGHEKDSQNDIFGKSEGHTKDTQGTGESIDNTGFSEDNETKNGTRKGHEKDTEGTRKDRNNNDNNENNNINNTINNVKKKYKYEECHLMLAKLLFKKMRENNPNAKEPNFEAWANTFRLMMERDNREGKEIQQLILWTQQHHFWHMNILSPDKLRKQYDRLLLEMKRDKKFLVISGGVNIGKRQSSYERNTEYDFNRREGL